MKKILFAIALLTGSLFITAPTGMVNAQFDAARDQACEGLGAGDNFIDCTEDGSSGISGVLEFALNLLSVVAGIIAVILIIIGGIKYITSQGDSQATSSARNTIIFAAVGLIIVVFSQIIVNFVLSEAGDAVNSSGTSQTQNTSSPPPGNNLIQAR